MQDYPARDGVGHVNHGRPAARLACDSPLRRLHFPGIHSPRPALSNHPGAAAQPRFYYGWATVALAALAMVGTLPGRTQGLGLITEPLLSDLRIDRVTFAEMNLWATLLGSLFCLPVGRLLDHLGPRVLLAAIALALGAVVLGMSAAHSTGMLFLLLILSRGFGQNALSIVSLTMVGHWFGRRLSLAMAIYSVTLSVGFMAAFPIVGKAVLELGWRTPWAVIGGCLMLGLAPLGIFFARRPPDAASLHRAGETKTTAEASAAADFTWGAALRTPAFWVFAGASSVYNLTASGIGLFNQSVLAERGFPPEIFHRSLIITALTSLAGNFLGGWLASKWSMNGLMAIAMTLLAGALIGLPSLRTVGQVDALSVVMGVAGGFVIVLFFTVWAKVFGRAQLGRIQGTAQMLTVLASAVGPLLLAKCHAWTGSYATVFYVLAGVVALLGLAAACLKMPRLAPPSARGPDEEPARSA